MTSFNSNRLRKILLSESSASIEAKVEMFKERLWVHELNKNRETEGEYHTLFSKLKKHPDKFFEYCRMDEETFNLVLDAMKDTIQKSETNFRKPISPEERLLVTLRFLATGCSFRSLAFTFRMGKTTISNIVVETCSAIWDKLLPTYLPEPTVDMWKSNSKDFYTNWNFPNCLGSIDGKHIRINQPQNTGSMYYNYKHFFSIHLLAVSDANYKFVMVDIGAYGRESDGGVLKNSEFFKKLQNKELNIPDNAELPNTNIKVPYAFIGDEAFPLLVNILRPYPGKQLINNNKKKVFNYRLSRARRTVENTFGILSSKWRILNKAIETNIENAIIITKAVCILHNVVLTHNKQPIQNIQHFLDEKIANISADGRRNNRFSTDARDTREIFADYFISEYGSVPWQMDYI